MGIVVASAVEKELQKLANSAKAVVLQRFFKTGPGEYGEGDKFFGITVPVLRSVAKKYSTLDFSSLSKLLESPWHEMRLLALLILVLQYQKAFKLQEKELCGDIYKFYISNFQRINNWDLVDLSAPHIVGAELFPKDQKQSGEILLSFSKDKNLWLRRIAIVSTFYFIRNNYFSHTLNISESLLEDKADLIHKASGWMLREVGKRDQECLENFLRKNKALMPRTMLRYAIERFPEDLRKGYLRGG
ncbi:MAG: DNA alkylation repair protein [Gammaproteobacteria bacterium]